MKDIKINKLQRDRDHWRYEAHKNPTDENWGAYRESRNKIKKAIKQIWKVIRIINPNMSTLQEDPCALNKLSKRLRDLSGKMQQPMTLYYLT